MAAKKRMFNLSVIDTDMFLDMPLTTQALYFHLNMRADDDGFVGSPRKIARLIGASEDDLTLLKVKNFVIQFEDGVIVIKHWRMHNTLSMNRYTETNFIEDKACLRIKENKAYTLSDEGKPLDDTKLIEMSARQTKDEQKTNNRRTIDEQKTNADKNRLDKNSKEEISNIYSREDDDKNTTAKKVLSYLNEKTGKNYRPVESNLKLIRGRLSDGYTYDDFVTVIDKKYTEWVGTDYEKYIQPSTLFAPSHFDTYLNQKEKELDWYGF